MWPIDEWVRQLCQFDTYLRQLTDWYRLPFASEDDQLLFQDQEHLVLFTVKTLQRLSSIQPRVNFEPNLHWYTYCVIIKLTNDAQMMKFYECIEQLYSIRGLSRESENVEFMILSLLQYDFSFLTEC